MSKTLKTIREQAAKIRRLEDMVDILVQRAYGELSKWELQDLNRKDITKKEWCRRHRLMIEQISLLTEAMVDKSQREESSA